MSKILYYSLSASLDQPLPLGRNITMRATADKRGGWVSRGQVEELLAKNKKLRAQLKKLKDEKRNQRLRLAS